MPGGKPSGKSLAKFKGGIGPAMLEALLRLPPRGPKKAGAGGSGQGATAGAGGSPKGAAKSNPPPGARGPCDGAPLAKGGGAFIRAPPVSSIPPDHRLPARHRRGAREGTGAVNSGLLRALKALNPTFV